MAKLENALGSRLFSRTNQRVELTEAGARFVAHARRIEREFNAALLAMSDVSQGKVTRIGVLNSVPGRAIALAHRLATGSATGPVEIIFGSERELTGHLERDRIDVALTILRPGPQVFAQREIIDEGYGMVMAPDHPLASRTQVDAEALRHETMIVRRHCEVLSLTSRYFLDRGVRPHFSLRTTNDERALQMVGPVWA